MLQPWSETFPSGEIPGAGILSGKEELCCFQSRVAPLFFNLSTPPLAPAEAMGDGKIGESHAPNAGPRPSLGGPLASSPPRPCNPPSPENGRAVLGSRDIDGFLAPTLSCSLRRKAALHRYCRTKMVPRVGGIETISDMVLQKPGKRLL